MCDPEITDEAALAIVQARCKGCHAEGGKADHMLLDLLSLVPDRGDVALRVAGCEMPPERPLPPNERKRLMSWGACAVSANP